MRIMEMPPLKPGYWYVNVAPLGRSPKWEAQIAPPVESGFLFGHAPADLLAKQYKPSRKGV